MKPLPLRERNKQKVSHRIIVVAVELFKTRGYHQTTIDDIAEMAEVSRRTLFNYFPSKEALLLPWAQNILDGHIYPALTTYLNTQPTTIECLRFLFTVIMETILASPDVVQAFVHEAFQSHDESQKMMVGNGLQELFSLVVRYGQARGEIRMDIPPAHLARYLSSLQGPLLFNLLESSQPTVESLDMDTLLAFIETGLRS